MCLIVKWARQQRGDRDLSSPGGAPCLWNLCEMTKLTFIPLGLSQGILIKKKKSPRPINLIYRLPITMASAVRHSWCITTKFKCYCFIQEETVAYDYPKQSCDTRDTSLFSSSTTEQSKCCREVTDRSNVGGMTQSTQKEIISPSYLVRHMQEAWKFIFLTCIYFRLIVILNSQVTVTWIITRIQLQPTFEKEIILK